MAQLINRGHNNRRLSRHLFQLLKDYPFLYGDVPRTTYQRVKHLTTILIVENSLWARYMDLQHQALPEKLFTASKQKYFSTPLTTPYHRFQLHSWFLHHFIFDLLSISYVICIIQLPFPLFHFFRITHSRCWSNNIFFLTFTLFAPIPRSPYSSSPGLHQTIFIYTFPLPLISFLQPGWEESSSAYPLHQR